MTRRNNVVSTYLSDDEKADLSRMSEQTGESQSSLVRKAVLEYLDRDRNARLEGKVRDLDDKVDRVLEHLSDDTSHTHKGHEVSNKATSVTEKARLMMRAIHDRDKDVIKSHDVELIIENYSGGDNRTIRKYKNHFRKRGLLLENPSEVPTWTTDTDMWSGWLVDYGNLNGREALDEFLEDYPASTTETAEGTRIDMDELEAAP